MSTGLGLTLTGVGLILTAAGWASYGAALVQGVARADVRPETGWEKVAFVLGHSKLVWAWVLLLALSASYLASASGSSVSTIAAVGGAAGYALLWAAVAALLTARHRSRLAQAGGSEDSATWLSTLSAVGGLGGAMAVGLLLLAAWMGLGEV